MTSGPQVLAEYNSSGTLVMEHIYANGGRIATVIPGNDTYYIAGDQIQSNRMLIYGANQPIRSGDVRTFHT